MPRSIMEDHKQFRDVITGKVRKSLKSLIKSGTLFNSRPVAITIPKMQMPNFGEEYDTSLFDIKPKKPKKFRSLDDEWFDATYAGSL